VWQSVASQTTVGDGDATFSLQSTGRTIRSLSAGLLNIPSFVFYFILFASSVTVITVQLSQ